MAYDTAAAEEVDNWRGSWWLCSVIILVEKVALVAVVDAVLLALAGALSSLLSPSRLLFPPQSPLLPPLFLPLPFLVD